jgi:hypothetical protein
MMAPVVLLFAMPMVASTEFEAYVQKVEAAFGLAAGTTQPVPQGLIHDWSAERFLPGRTPKQVIAVLQSYGRYREVYPEVVQSRVMSQSGNRFRVALQLKRKKILTVVLDTEYEVEYKPLADGSWLVHSRSTKVTETDGGDHGFLWRLNTYWRIVPEGNGVRVQCRSVSLSRDVPVGLGWAVKPMVSHMPRESLEAMLAETVKAIQ